MSISENEVEYRRIATRFLPTEESIHSIRAVAGGFSSSPVFQIDTTFATYALKGWKASHWPVARVLERHRWLQFLSSNRIPVATPLKDRFTGSSVYESASGSWQLEQWMPGGSSTLSEMTPNRWRSMMTTLATMHQASSRFKYQSAGKGWFAVRHAPSSTLEERRLIIATWTAEKRRRATHQLQNAPRRFRESALAILSAFSQFAPQVDQQLAALEVEKVLLIPCHRDLWNEHVLFSGDTVSGIIDPTAARSEHIASDLSRLLSSFLDDSGSSWKPALDLYQSIAPLSSIDMQMIDAFRVSSIVLSGMTWVERFAFRPELELTDSILHRIELITQRLSHLK
ncbi:phosphotransferase enzyme family protein [Planctomicrobium sp. SH668]|uniref:phosphotransferase enzyme family protein n=1 Tax=Planctomicrobium sp. SH668 TaxID=3448126 RepID=UPI003F5C350F